MKHIQNFFGNWIFTRSILKALPTHSQDILTKLKYTALVTASLSGFIFGFAIHKVLGVPFIPPALGMMLMVLLIETLFLSPGDFGKRTRYLRIVIAILMVGVHSMVLDIWIMKSDIEHHFAEENAHKATEIDRRYQQKIDQVTERIDKLQDQNHLLQAQQKELNDRVYAEISVGSGERQAGYGLYARKFEAMGKEESDRIAPQVAANDSLIKQLNQQVAEFRLDQRHEKSELIAPESRGLMDRIERAWQLVFVNGNTHTIMAYLLLFGFMLVLDLVPLIRKGKAEEAYQDYLRLVAEQRQQERDEVMRQNSLQRKSDRELEEIRSTLTLEESKKKEELDFKRRLLNLEQEHNKQIAEDVIAHEMEQKRLKERKQILKLNGYDPSEPVKRGPGRPPKQKQ